MIVSFKNRHSTIPLFRPQGNDGSIEKILYFQLVVEIPIHSAMLTVQVILRSSVGDEISVLSPALKPPLGGVMTDSPHAAEDFTHPVNLVTAVPFGRAEEDVVSQTREKSRDIQPANDPLCQEGFLDF